MEEKIMSMLNDICGAEDGELEPDLDLFEAGLLDSFGVVQLVVDLEEQFAVSLKVEQLAREDIATPAKIIALVQQAAA